MEIGKFVNKPLNTVLIKSLGAAKKNERKISTFLKFIQIKLCMESGRIGKFWENSTAKIELPNKSNDFRYWIALEWIHKHKSSTSVGIWEIRRSFDYSNRLSMVENGRFSKLIVEYCLQNLSFGKNFPKVFLTNIEFCPNKTKIHIKRTRFMFIPKLLSTTVCSLYLFFVSSSLQCYC